MAKDSNEKTSPKDHYEGFIKQYGAWLGAQKMSKAAVSEDVNARESARNYALKHAEANVPGYEGISKDPVARAQAVSSQATIDNLLQHSEMYNGTLATNRFRIDGKDIIANTSEKGLAAIVLDKMLPVKLGNTEYDVATKAHKGYVELTQILSAEDPDHRQLIGTLIPTLVKKTKEKFAEDKYLGNDENLMKATINASTFLLAGSKELSFRGVVGMRDSYKKEFEKELSTDVDKAKYAKELLMNYSENPKTAELAMSLVYEAHQAGSKKK